MKNGNNTDKTVYRISKFLFENGELGVNVFFVLSGFLITFLLLREKKITGGIHVGRFYLRRLLRIWPLFYACVVIGFVMMPLLKQLAGGTVNENADPLYYILFINNFDYIHHWPQVPDALILIVLWSIAVEEQFYLFWPVLLSILPRKVYPYIFISIIIFTLFFRSFYTGNSDHAYAVRNFHTLAVIGDMAMGALFAYYCSYQSKLFIWIKGLSKFSVVCLYCIVLLLYFFRKQLLETGNSVIFERLILSVFFALVICEQNFSKNSIFKFSNFKKISLFGNYTYALYCLHFFVISLVVGAALKFGLKIESWIAAIGISITALIVSIMSAALSYNYFEKPFLRLKDKFAFVKKG